MGFPRQEYWSGLPCPPPGDLPNPGIELTSPALAVKFFTAEPTGKPINRVPVYESVPGTLLWAWALNLAYRARLNFTFYLPSQQ